MKIAIFYDWLNQWGGAERVLLNLLKIYSCADLYTLVHHPSKAKWLPPTTKIFPSILNKFPLSSSNHPFYTPFYAPILECFDFSGYDIVIATTSVIGHALLTPPRTLFVCYYHNINRHLYLKHYPFLQPLLNTYRRLDFIYSRRPDHLLCNSLTVQKRIAGVYRQPATVIHPGINTDFFRPSNSPPNNYFLIVSRLVPHKNIDIAIHACGRLGLPLKIVGTGRFQNYLKSVARSYKSIEFMGYIDDYQLKSYYQNCKALICPQEEDFGLTPLECQACGRPVIALNRGGCTETVLADQTGIFFPHQTPSSLVRALKLFVNTTFDPHSCRQQALRYSDNSFMLHFKETIDRLWLQHHQSPNLNATS